MEPPRENSPSTPSRYLNSYLQQNPTELFHQNFPQRQLSNQQFYAAAAADGVTTNNKNFQATLFFFFSILLLRVRVIKVKF